MKNLDTLYEAYQNYKKLCIVDNDTDRFFRSYMNVKDRASEDIVSIYSVCHIEQDWVNAIEVGIPFFEKAIREERQFIRNDGEVLPIEKIRKTSKTSIQDLAKHANYITHEAPEDAETEVLPDKMLMIQKESDFAIYENRVLYAGLMYLKDFVTSRLVTIKEATNTYLVKQHINKLIDMGSRKVNISLNFDESRVNDPLLTEKNIERTVIEQLDEILTNILALLKTPLMREVSKVEMVSRPIAKTNILKMNRNFREALACFEYIANYQGEGFTIEKIEKSLIPYSKQMNEAYSENLIMLSFINYMFANNLGEELRQDYEEIIKERELRKENELLARLRNIKTTAADKGQSLDQFLLDFEQGYRILEARNDELTQAMQEKEADHKKELIILQRQHEEEIDKINAEHRTHIAEVEEAGDKKVEETREAIQNELNAEREKLTADFEAYKATFADHIAQMEKENAEIKSHYQEQTDRIAVLEAEVLQNRVAKGDASPIEYTSEESFNRLEQMKNDFDSFFERTWKATKKQIRKEVLFGKRKKGKKEPVIEETPAVEQTPIINETPASNEPVEIVSKEEPIVDEQITQETPFEESALDQATENEPLNEGTSTEEPEVEESLENDSPSEDHFEDQPVDEEILEEDATVDEPLKSEGQINEKEAAIDEPTEENVEPNNEGVYQFNNEESAAEENESPDSEEIKEDAIE